MAAQEGNEITVRVVCTKEELISFFAEKGFTEKERFSLWDSYFVPECLELPSLSAREILSKAVLVRQIFDGAVYHKKLTYKIKEFNAAGEILRQKAVNCDICDIAAGKALLKAMGYEELMQIREDDIVYQKDGLELAVKDVTGGDLLIEAETASGTAYDTIPKLKAAVAALQIPIQPNEYFVKKAEIALEKALLK